ncbi:MAG: hypothetical protein FWG08_07210 [Propionibacteriaceae bacterium]|nr:hypothetical protein [Propionibacteriaceae bacterium]
MSAGVSALARIEDFPTVEKPEPGMVKDSPLANPDPDQIEHMVTAVKDTLSRVVPIAVTVLVVNVETSVMIVGTLAETTAGNLGGKDPPVENSVAILQRGVL